MDNQHATDLLRQRAEAAALPERTVSGEEFVALLVRVEGLTEGAARTQLFLSRALGSAVRCGGEMIRPGRT